MADCPVKEKQPKIDHASCIICGVEAPSYELVKPKDINSWQTLLDAAKIRLLYPILNLTQDAPSTVPNAFYHRECRSDFTHKKELPLWTCSVNVNSLRTIGEVPANKCLHGWCSPLVRRLLGWQ